MDRKDYMNIAGITLVFLFCAAAGFGGAYLVRKERTQEDVAVRIINGSEAAGMGHAGESDPTYNGAAAEAYPDDPATRDLDPDDVCNADSWEGDAENRADAAQPEQPKAVKLIASTGSPTWPREGAKEPPYSYNFAVTLTEDAKSGSAELINGKEHYRADITMYRGVPYANFTGVLPAGSGEYLLRVTNADGLVEERPVKGFGLMDKWKAVKIVEQLNTTTDKNFFRHFTPTLKMNFVGIADGVATPQSLSQLGTDLSSQGWTVSEVRDVKYDRFNRVESMTIVIKTEQ